MAGYFKVSIEAAKAIAEHSHGPFELAGYMTLCSYAFGNDRDITAAGAKAIKQTLGCSDFRSKKVMAFLRDKPFFGIQLISPTKRTIGNARVHQIAEWPGEYAYLPSLLVDRSVRGQTPLSRLLQAQDFDSSTLRDALILFLHVYTNVDYGGWFGCPPDLMANQEWRTDGTAGELDHELGHMGDIGSYAFWLVARPEDDTWHVPKSVIADLFGKDEGASDRFWKALWCLLRTDLLVRVLSIQSGSWSYPLWVFSPSYRETLAGEFGPVGAMAADCQRWANRAGLDPDNYIIAQAAEQDGNEGTGMFFCIGDDPKPRLVLAPRLHAPTPMNLDGIREAATTAAEIARDVSVALKASDVA